jgi:hypothetical protein
MSGDTEDLQGIAERIAQGEDPYEVPPELLVEPEGGQPVDRSLYTRIHMMTIPERIKLALRGNREARMILVRDPNKLIQRFVLQNPRITDDEILAVARNRNIESETLKLIGDSKIWVRNYPVRLALASNPKTPLATALHFVQTLAERDLRLLAKSKHVSATVVTQARRLLMLRDHAR